MMSKYEDEIFINKYVDLWAYGYYNGFCGCEAVYRIVKELAIEEYSKFENLSILDIGTGVGRTAGDLSQYFVNSDVLGIDNSTLSLRVANSILKNRDLVSLKIDLSSEGFDCIKIPTNDINNLTFLRTDFEELDKSSFNIITAVNFIDRCKDPEYVLDKIYSMLKPNAFFIGALPFNFSTKKNWRTIGTSHDFLNLLKNKFEIITYLQEVNYREILDGRGNYNEFKVDIFKVKRL